MVVARLAPGGIAGTLPKYLVVSVCANVLIASAVDLEVVRGEHHGTRPGALQVRLGVVAPSVAAPSPTPVPPAHQAQQSVPAEMQDVAAERQAAQKVSRPAPEPVRKARKDVPADRKITARRSEKGEKSVPVPEAVLEAPTLAPAHDQQPAVLARANRRKNTLPEPQAADDVPGRPGQVARVRPLPVAPSSADAQPVAAVVHEARYRRRTVPVYPPRALELGQQGRVMLHAWVAHTGLPVEMKVVESSGHRLLDMAALAAIRKWEFEPTSRDGVAIASWVRVPVHFVIQQ